MRRLGMAIRAAAAGSVPISVSMLLLASAGPLWAGDVKVDVTVDRSQVPLNGQLNLTVTVTTEGDASSSDPEVDVPDVFEVIGTSSSTNSSFQFVNGGLTSSVSRIFGYTLKPSTLGTFQIGPARVQSQDRTVTSKSVTVEVIKATGRGQARPVPRRGGQAQDVGTLQELEENLFVRAILDKETVSVGEQTTVTYKLYTRYNIQQLEYNRLPSFTGFWAETTYEAPRSPATSREVIDGRSYSVIDLRKVALFPTTAGSHQLEQLEVRCEIPVRRKGRSPFDLDDFFSFDPFGRSQQVLVRSEDVKLEVKALPPGATGDFDGAVGSYEIEVSAKPLEVKAGDPVAVVVSISGNGHLNSVREPRHAEDPEFRFYDPKVITETEVRQGRFGGVKTFEYVVIPRREGMATLPTFVLTYFDPSTGSYRTAQTKETTLRVLPGEAAASPVAGLSRQDIRLLGEDIRHIKPDQAQLSDHSRETLGDWRFLTVQVIPVIGFLIAFGVRRHQDRLSGDVAYARRRRSSTEALRRLSDAQNLMESGDRHAFFAEVHRAATQFLADRLNLSSAGMTAESASSALSSRGVDEALVERLGSLMQTCDFARFAPGGSSEDETHRVYEEAEGLIDDLGRVI